jgi:hypothetical protein
MDLEEVLLTGKEGSLGGRRNVKGIDLSLPRKSDVMAQLKYGFLAARTWVAPRSHENSLVSSFKNRFQDPDSRKCFQNWFSIAYFHYVILHG